MSKSKKTKSQIALTLLPNAIDIKEEKTHKYFDLDEFASAHPEAYAALVEGDDEFEECFEDSDILLYEYEGDLYSESHDEYLVLKWSAPVWVELKWDDRPKG